MTKKEGTTTVAYTYGAYNRLTSTNSSLTFTYDNNGNTLSKIEGGDTWNYTYNYNNMMTKAVKNSVTQGQYFYDGENKRVKVIEGSTLINMFNGLNIIYQKNMTSGSISKFFFANGLVIAKNNGSSTYYHQDSLGSTRLTTSSSKLQIFASNYKPFGPLYNQSGTEKVKYTGKWEDSPTKLYYFGARYYDPEIGRFTTQDTVVTINQYIYANNNPYKYIDPTGREPVRKEIGSYELIVDYIRGLEASHPGAKPTEILNMIVNREGPGFGQPKFGDGYPKDARYIYSESAGFVDMLHFFDNAKLGANYGIGPFDPAGIALDYGVEIGQAATRDRPSAFSYEDITSNRLGRAFGVNVLTSSILVTVGISDDKPLSQQFSDYMKNIGASTNPEETIKKQHPGLWETIPENRDAVQKTGFLPASRTCVICYGPAIPDSLGSIPIVGGILSWAF